MKDRDRVKSSEYRDETSEEQGMMKEEWKERR